MKNYKEMSDFEINKSVHLLMLKYGAIKEQFRLNDSDYVDVFHNAPNSQSVIAVMRYIKNGLSDGYNPFGGAFNYCNNPSDAWPIIVENKISLITDETTNEWTTGRVIDFTDETAYKYNTQDLKPLRSAMITFLMMKEKEQETK